MFICASEYLGVVSKYFSNLYEPHSKHHEHLTSHPNRFAKTRYSFKFVCEGFVGFGKGLERFVCVSEFLCVISQDFSNIYEPLSKHHEPLTTRPKWFTKRRYDI